jgi:hypothetical protein
LSLHRIYGGPLRSSDSSKDLRAKT